MRLALSSNLYWKVVLVLATQKLAAEEEEDDNDDKYSLVVWMQGPSFTTLESDTKKPDSASSLKVDENK